MLAIGRILRTGARFLLLDEPTEGLAPVIVQQIGATIRRLKAEGFTILLVEQNFRFAATVADRHYVMERGRVVDMIAQRRARARAWTSSTSTSGYNSLPRRHDSRRLPHILHDKGVSVMVKRTAHRAGRRCWPSGRWPRSLRSPTGSIKIGVLNDQSGLYADLAGQGSVVAARMAVEDFGADKKGMKVEIVSADHQNKADVGIGHRAAVVRRGQGGRDRGRAQLRGGPRRQPDRARRRTRRSSSRARPPPISRARPARPTPSTGPTTRGRSPTAPAMPS